MKQRRDDGDGAEYKKIRRGWCYGEASFRQELLGQMAAKVGACHYGEEIRETAQAKAGRIVGEELKKLRWNR